MTLRTRRTLFYGLVALFFIIGAIVVFYAQGWRFDFRTFTTQKVGAVYVRSYPKDAQISLSGKSVRNASNFLSPGTLISDLFPGNYQLSLTASGYDDWTENATVAPTLVTEMKYAVLIPSTAASAASTPGLSTFFESGGNVITQTASGTVSRESPSAPGENPSGAKSPVIGRGTIVSHSNDFTTVVIKSAAGTFSAYQPASATTTNLSAIIANQGVSAKSLTDIAVDPYDGNTIFVESVQKMFSIALPGGAVTPIAAVVPGQTLEQPLALSSSWLAWARFNNASGTSRIFVYDPFSGNAIDSSLSLPGHIKGLTWIRTTLLGVLGEDGELYRYDVPSESLTKIADDVRDFYPTDDGAMIATLESRSIEIFSLTTDDYYRFNLPDIASAQSLDWYRDSTHLFVTYPTHVNFLDLADLSLRNFTAVSQIATGTAPFYDAQENSLYLIDQGGKLIRFDFPS